MDCKSEDLQDLVWMKDNLKMDIMSDPTTLKKTWEEGRVAKLAQANPSMRQVFGELGLIVLSDDDTVHSVSQNRHYVQVSMLILDLRPFLLARSPGLAPDMVIKAEAQAVALPRGKLTFFSHHILCLFTPSSCSASSWLFHIHILFVYHFLGSCISSASAAYSSVSSYLRTITTIHDSFTTYD
jgi:hypothetical protein